MNTAQVLLQAQIAIHMYSTKPTLENLIHLHQSLFLAKSMLPGIPLVQQHVPLPKERVAVPRILGDGWLGVNLDRFYQRLIKTCMENPRAQSVAVRIQTTPYVFTEVLIGRILLPLQMHFERESSFENAYTSVTEPVFLYFASTEGKPYNPEDAFRTVNPHGLTNAGLVFLISVLETYDTSRFRTSSRKGTVHIMFNPSNTRSARDLTRDFFIQRFNSARAALITFDGRGSPMQQPALQFQPTRPTTPESDDGEHLSYPDVVSDVFQSVFG